MNLKKFSSNTDYYAEIIMKTYFVPYININKLLKIYYKNFTKQTTLYNYDQ